jgi:hypothetical protein
MNFLVPASYFIDTSCDIDIPGLLGSLLDYPWLQKKRHISKRRICDYNSATLYLPAALYHPSLFQSVVSSFESSCTSTDLGSGEVGISAFRGSRTSSRQLVSAVINTKAAGEYVSLLASAVRKISEGGMITNKIPYMQAEEFRSAVDECSIQLADTCSLLNQ